MLDFYSERQRRKRGPARPQSQLTIVAAGVTALFVLLICIILGVAMLFAWYAKDLPRPDKVRRVDGLSTIIYDRNGVNLYDIFQDQNRIPVDIAEIPTYLRQGTVAVEDKDFYHHQGLSTTGIIRAMLKTVLFHGQEGGSTLTQQLVKNVLLTNERTLPRKIKEAILSIQIERKYSKDEILQMYLNEAPYGGTAVGVEAAAQYYFSKHVKELNLVECAILAGLPQSPSGYSPYGSDPKAYIWRTQQVLRRMREDTYITADQEKMALTQIETVKFGKSELGLKAPHFVSYIKDILVDKFGEKMVESGGLHVTTTLDYTLQQKAQDIVKEEVDKIKALKVSNGAAVVINPKTGEILAMVGSKDYNSTDSGGFKFNVVTQGLRQPGSTMKPITYAAAFKKGYTASTLLVDADTKYPSGDPKKPEYNPKNYDGKFHGPMQLRYALGNSINTIAVKVSALAGIREILRLSYDMGISTLEPTDDNLKRFGLSLTLGGGEVKLLDITSAFGVFATAGQRMEPVSLLKVEDAKGTVLYEYKPPAPKRVMAADVAYLISHILSDNGARKDAFGERSLLAIPGRTIAVKTGTTDDKRDNWTIGYSTNIVVGTWVGNNDNSPMNPALASGITGAASLWNRIIKEAIKDQKEEAFSRPDTIVETDVDTYGGGLPVDGTPSRKEVFIKGTEPTTIAPIYQKLKVSKKDNNKLANQVEIAKGEYDTKTFIVFTETDPVSGDGKNRWQEGVNTWVGTQNDGKFKPPKDTYEGTDKVSIRIKEPNDQSQINSNTVHVVADGASLFDVSKIEIFIDGTLVKDKGDKSISEDVSVSNGIRTIKAKATDSKGNTAETEVHIGVNTPYVSPTPTPTPTTSP